MRKLCDHKNVISVHIEIIERKYKDDVIKLEAVFQLNCTVALLAMNQSQNPSTYPKYPE